MWASTNWKRPSSLRLKPFTPACRKDPADCYSVPYRNILASTFLVSSAVFVALPPCPTVLNRLVASPPACADVFGMDFSVDVDVDGVAPSASFFSYCFLAAFFGLLIWCFLVYPNVRITAAGNRFTEPTPPPRSPFVYTLAFRKAWKDLADDNGSGSR